MEPISISTELNLADWRALLMAAGRRAHQNISRAQRLLSRLPSLTVIALVIVAASLSPDADTRIAWVLGPVIGLLAVAISVALAARRQQPRPGGMFLDPVRIDIDATGLRQTRRNSEGLVRWAQILGVEVTPAYLFLWTDLLQGIVIPGRSLPPSLTTQTLADRIHEFMAAAPAVLAPTDGAAAPGFARRFVHDECDAAGDAGAAPSVWQELATVARLLVMRPIDARRIVGRDLSIFVLAAILLAVWTALEPLVSEYRLELSWYSLPSLAWVAMGVLALAWLLLRLSTPRFAYRRGLLLATGALPIAMIVATLYEKLDDVWFYPLVGLTTVWSVVYFKRALLALTGDVQARAIMVAAFATAGFVLASHVMYVNPSLWYYADDQESGEEEETPFVDARTWERMEALQFAQQSRLDTELARLAALPRETAASWFVGFAGYGEQRVFAEEIALAAGDFAERYGTGKRCIRLVNDQRDPAKLPLASAPALSYTLRRLGAMMGPDDVLFLALSSHGSEDGSISVSNAGRTPADLGATELATMLREARIPWKVIVISACYAGSFIDALRDDHTIVLAAAAADRTSFGCSDDRDLTYFGEAFYRDALPAALNLRVGLRSRAQAHRRARESRSACRPRIRRRFSARRWRRSSRHWTTSPK